MNCVSSRKCESPIMSFCEHFHDTCEIVLQLTETVNCRVGEKNFTMVPGDILIIPPYTAHVGRAETGYTDICFCVKETEFKEICLLKDKNDYVKNLMNMLHKTFIERDNNYQVICDALVNAILQYLKSFKENTEKYDFVSIMKEKIYDNISNADFKIKDEIKKMGYNEDYFRRCFFEDTGKTPLEYLTDMRVNNAKSLLKQEKFMSILEVSSRCGFSDRFYFSRKFKQITGKSPLDYRKIY